MVDGSDPISLKVQRHMSNATSLVRSSFEKLSSGLRINKASDDAAGLAVSSMLGVESRIAMQGYRNVNDAIALSNIAIGAANELSSIVIRMRELAEQASNGAYSDVQRKASNLEAQALRNEYNRIIQATEYNGISLFGSSQQPLEVSIGGNTTALNMFGIDSSYTNDGTFKAMSSYTAGVQAITIKAVRANDDPYYDLMTVDRLDGTVSVLLGNGDGSFKNRMVFQAGVAGFDLAYQDITNDGIADLIVTNVEGSFSVLQGNGDGSFSAQVTYNSVGSIHGLQLVDVNSDGKADAVMTDYIGNAIRIHLGNGNGSFKAPLSIASAGTNTVAIQAKDLNGDGKIDLISAAEAESAIRVYYGNGDGTFTAANLYTTSAPTNGLGLADLNGDGIDDLVISKGASGFGVMLGNGNGTFQAERTYPTGGSKHGFSLIDISGDGIIDLISPGVGENATSIFIGNGDGTFKARTSYDNQWGPSSSALADFNNDGTLDIGIALWGSNAVGVMLGNGANAARLAPFSLATRYDALSALTELSRSQSIISASVGKYGAAQSRLSSIASVLLVRNEGVVQAQSRIRDVDVADEYSTLVHARVLQQVGSALLAQANSQSALMLKLLQ